MGRGSALLSGGLSGIDPILRDTKELTFGVDGFIKYKLFGGEYWITTTHISLIIIMVIIIALAIAANRAIKKANPDEVPGMFLNVIEYLVESVDNLTKSNMGTRGYRFSNYIGTLAIFILTCNISGLFGLRPPTADYGVTLSLALITFVLIHYNGFKYQKAEHVTNLFKPLPLTPINIIGEFATPLSMSLRLFGNILSGTVMMGLLYGLIPMLIKSFIWPVFGTLHVYFDVFSGGIQTFVFCMLTMVFISNTFPEE